jgi:hypothetical protein
MYCPFKGKQNLNSLKVDIVSVFISVPRRPFFAALQWIAIAQSPKLHQKNQL